MALKRQRRGAAPSPRQRLSASCRAVLCLNIIEMAGNRLRSMGNGLWPFVAAAVEGEGAARVERTAGGNRGKPRHAAWNLDQPRGLARQGRDRAHQALGIGVQRILHDLLDRKSVV